MHSLIISLASPVGRLILTICGLLWLAWLVTRREDIPPASGATSTPVSVHGRITAQEPWFVRDPAETTTYKSKLVVTLTVSGETAVRFKLPCWIDCKGDVGLQTPFGCGYWIYPKGQTTWVDAAEPTVEPTNRFHVWIGLDQACSDSELKTRSMAKRLGTLRVPIEIEGKSETLEYRL
jgi:hypothetical protein